MFWRNFWLLIGVMGIIMMITGTIFGGLVVSSGAFLQVYWIEEAREEKEKARLQEIEKLKIFVDKTIKEFIEEDEQKN